MNKLTWLCALTFMIISVSSCSRKILFTKSVVVPSASGRVKMKKEKNGNYDLAISVRDLTSARNLVPPRETYVVWSQTKQNGIMNIGQLGTSRSFLSRGFKASLSTSSPYKPKRIFITGEDKPTVTSPGTQVVLTTEDF
jgi:hypothetical protein